ncbi:PREDICTED: tripartite motif-containing protein 3-like [Branchiostoma belcheri]|uniref:RING-type E3 ubiquitin transferase n=1 Tax=Branchiostoma belcheri TaxID=7741 RepID=A0A6P4ZRE5_BRABE|nr:PREDICTED: tripartite motif-containing protein 3-like [Branchiostoma belcheri]
MADQPPDGFREEIREEFLTCSICMEVYTRPKMLPCVHTFCQRCLEGYAAGKPSIACPTCRREVVLPSGGVQNLTDNFYIASLCAKVSSPASHETHQTTGQTPAPQAENPCSNHPGNQVRSFCRTCQIATCAECADHHPGHAMDDIETVLTEKRGQIGQTLEHAKGRIHKLYGFLDELDQADSQAERSFQSAESLVHQTSRRLVEEVCRQQEGVVADLRARAAARRAELTQQRERVQKTMSDLIVACRRAEEDMRTTDIQAMSTRQHDLTEIVTSQGATDLNLSGQEVEFKPCSDAVSIGQLGVKDSGGTLTLPQSPTRPQAQQAATVQANITIGGLKGRGAGQFDFPTDVAVTNFHIFVLDKGNNRVQVLDKRGSFVRAFETGNEFSKPQGIAVNPSGQVVVTDLGNGTVKIFSQEGELLEYFGEGFAKPCGISIHPWTGVVAISDIQKERVTLHRPDGSLLLTLNSRGEGNKSFKKPAYVGTLNSGGVLISDNATQSLKLYSRAGEFVRAVGKTTERVDGSGQLRYPRGIIVDNDDNIIVADADNGTVDVFDSNGKFLLHTANKADGLKRPTGLALLGDRRLVVTDTATHSVLILNMADKDILPRDAGGTDSPSKVCSVM